MAGRPIKQVKRCQNGIVEMADRAGDLLNPFQLNRLEILFPAGTQLA
jgi:hypothetical protein